MGMEETAVERTISPEWQKSDVSVALCTTKLIWTVFMCIIPFYEVFVGCISHEVRMQTKTRLLHHQTAHVRCKHALWIYHIEACFPVLLYQSHDFVFVNLTAASQIMQNQSKFFFIFHSLMTFCCQTDLSLWEFCHLSLKMLSGTRISQCRSIQMTIKH